MPHSHDVKEVGVGSVYGTKKNTKTGYTEIETGWSNAPTLINLKADFDRASNHHQTQVDKINDWLDALFIRGNYKIPKRKGRSSVAPALIRRQIEWKTPSFTEPYLSTKQLIEVNPRSWEDRAASQQNTTILNYQLKNKIDLVNLMDTIVCRMETEGTAVLKPTWDHKSSVAKKEEREYDYDIDPSLAEPYTGILQQLEQDPELINDLSEEMEMGLRAFVETGEPRAYYVTEIREVEEEKVIRNQPSVEVCDNEDVLVDPSCKNNVKNAKYIIHRYDTCLADLQEANIYKNLDEVERHVKSTTEKSKPSSDFRDAARKTISVCEYWGYWDINGDGFLSAIVATWYDDILIQLDLSPYDSGKLPFIFIPLNRLNKETPFGEAEAELITQNQQILGAVLRGAIDLLGRSSNGQKGYAKNFLDSTNKRKFSEGEDYEYSMDGDPAKSIHEHRFPELPNSVFSMIQYANNDSDSMTGVQAFSQGVQSASLGNVATGMKNAIGAAAKRDASVLRRISQGIVEISYFIIEMNSMFLSDQDVVRLTNKEFVQVDPDNLSGDFDLILDISTVEADLSNIENLSMLLQVGQTSLPFDYTKKILASIARLARLYELEQFIEEYEPEPDPFQEQMQQAEIQEAMLKNELLQAQIERERAEAAVKLAEIGVRDARADNIQSQTDKANIGNYSKINGHDQEEKLEQIREQNKAKATLEDQRHLNSIDSKRFDHNSGLRKEAALASLQEPSDNNQP